MKKTTMFVSLLTSLFGKAQDEGKLVLVDSQDKKMEEAFVEAKKSLDNFIFRATKQKSENEIYGAYIKVVEEENIEFLWVSDFKKYDDKYFIGVLITTPELIKKFKYGQTIGFIKEDIFDWQIYNKVSDTLEGAFTFKVIEDNK